MSRAKEAVTIPCVTDSNRYPGDPIDNRNAKLAETEKRLSAIAGEPSDAERAARTLRWKAEHDGGLCARCGRDLQSGEPVYFVVIKAGHGLFGGYSCRYGYVCQLCASPRSSTLWRWE